MEHVLITGAGGYIGKYVVREALLLGFRVTAVDLNLDRVDDAADKLCVDIFSGGEDIYDTLGQPDLLIHMAWKDGFVHNSPAHLKFLFSHYEFIQRMLAGGLKHISVMGTMHEIGYWEGEIDENTPTNPLSFYGIAKNALNEACKVLVNEYSDVVFQWLRVYYILGDDVSNNSLFTKITKWERAGKSSFPFTSGQNKYDFISVDELACQIVAASAQSDVLGIINCCTGNPVSLEEKVEQFLKEKNFSIRPEYGAYPDRPYDSPAVWGNANKIQKIMNDMRSKFT